MTRNWILLLSTHLLAACGPAEVAGIVRDERGAALAGAKVSVWRVGGSGWAHGRTDSLGRFRIRHTGEARGRVVLQACVPGYTIVQQGWADERELPDTVELRMARHAPATLASGC